MHHFALGLLVLTGLRPVRNIFDQRKSEAQIINPGKPLNSTLAIIIGIFAGAAFYLPIFSDVFLSPYADSRGLFSFDQVPFYWGGVSVAFASDRIALCLIAIAGLFVGHQILNKQRNALLLLGALAIVPLLLVVIRGDQAPLRVFTVYMPVYAIIVGLGIDVLWRRAFSHDRYDLIFVAAVAAYCLLVFRTEMSKMSDQLYSDLLTGTRSQGIYYQYYSDHYRPVDEIRILEESTNSEAPVMVAGCEPHGLPVFLDEFGLSYAPIGVVDSVLNRHEEAFIISNHPMRFHGMPWYRTELVSDDLSYHTVISVRKRDSDVLGVDSISSFGIPWTIPSPGWELLNAESEGQSTDASGTFSNLYVGTFKEIGELPAIALALEINNKEKPSAEIVLDVRRDGAPVFWTNLALDQYYSRSGLNVVFAKFDLPIDVQNGDSFKLFIWNRGGDKMTVQRQQLQARGVQVILE